MTCNFCGSVLEDNEVECPYCGHKTGLENYAPVDVEKEFDDLEPEEVTKASGEGGKARISLPKINFNKKSAPREEPAEESHSAPSRQKKVVSLAGSNPATVLPLIGFAACALLLIVCLISVASVKARLNDMNQSILSQFYQLQNTDQKISDRLDELGSTVGNVSTTINEQSTSRNINITKEPTSTATYLGRGGADDTTQNVPIFTVEATGANLAFAWQRFDEASGSWVNVVFDASSNNETYGVHVYTDASKGYSELAAHGVTAEGFGSYRCQISDNFGNKNTETVVLSERQKDA